jgi:omega-6 fatty acid desaturase (delta-12 desaturase)
MFQEVKPITLFASVKSLTFRLWDEEGRKLVGFGYLKDLQNKHAMASQQ